jgi:hypothetical protein
VARHVEAQRLLLLGQPLGVGHLGQVGQAEHRGGGPGAVGRREGVEEALLAALAVLLPRLAPLHRAGQDGQELAAPRAEAVERAGLDQRLGAALADLLGRDPLEEVIRGW